MRGFTLILAGSLLVPFSNLFAQELLLLEPGARVRMTARQLRVAEGRQICPWDIGVVLVARLAPPQKA